MSSYVWSVFDILANTDFRPYRPAAAALRSAMTFYKRSWLAMQDSRYYHFMKGFMADDVALMNEISYVNGRENLLATDIAAYIDMFGTTNKIVQVS